MCHADRANGSHGQSDPACRESLPERVDAAADPLGSLEHGEMTKPVSDAISYKSTPRTSPRSDPAYSRLAPQPDAAVSQ